jgi:hypothetical protein
LQRDVREAWEREQQLLGLARDTSDDRFAAEGLAVLAVEPTVRIVVLPGDPAAQPVGAAEPNSVLPRVVKVGSMSLPIQHTIRGTASGYVAYADASEGNQWASFIALHWHGGVDFYLGTEGGRRWPAETGPRVVFLKRSVAWAWGAFDLQRQAIEQYSIAGPYRAIIGVANTAGTALGNLGVGWAEPGSPMSFGRPEAVEPRVLLTEDLAEWPDADGIEALALRFGARLDLAFGGPGRRHLDHQGPNAGKYVAQ